MYLHGIKSRGITNFHSSWRFSLGIPSLAVVVQLQLIHRCRIPRRAIWPQGAMLNKSGPGCGDSGFMVRRQQRSAIWVEDAGPRVTSGRWKICSWTFLFLILYPFFLFMRLHIFGFGSCIWEWDIQKPERVGNDALLLLSLLRWKQEIPDVNQSY